VAANCTFCVRIAEVMAKVALVAAVALGAVASSGG
jgi:hypothetical protein